MIRKELLENLYVQTQNVDMNLAAQLSVKHFAVTRGTKGVMLLDNEGGKTYTVPALST